VVLFLVGIDFIVKNITERTFAAEKTSPPSQVYLIVVVTALIGVLSGILANGGGLFLVPAYVIFFQMKIKEAIPTSLLTVAVLSLPGSVIHYHLGHIDLVTTAFMAIGVIPMAYLGAKLDIKTESKTILLLYGLVMATFSVYFFISQIRQ
jgi:uncharacterized membrane protein YfcA